MADVDGERLMVEVDSRQGKGLSVSPYVFDVVDARAFEEAAQNFISKVGR